MITRRWHVYSMPSGVWTGEFGRRCARGSLSNRDGWWPGFDSAFVHRVHCYEIGNAGVETRYRQRGRAIVHLVVQCQLLRIGAEAHNVKLGTLRGLPSDGGIARVIRLTLHLNARHPLRQCKASFSEDSQIREREFRVVRRMNIANTDIAAAHGLG